MMEWKKYKFWYRTFEVNEKGKIRNEHGKILRGSKHRNGFLTINLRLKDDKGEITYKGLIMHQKKLGRHGNSKLTTKEVLKIKRLLNKKETPIIDIARAFNVSHTQIQRIKRGENW